MKVDGKLSSSREDLPDEEAGRPPLHVANCL